ncbi:MAG: histidine phosphotransferase, partial [Azorhizobium sp. 32-67-21]
MEDQRTRIEWTLPRELQPKNRVKLLLNLALLAGTTIPRGGVITASAPAGGSAVGFVLTTAGPSARIPAALPDLTAGRAPADGLDAHAIQPYYAGLLARECGLVIAFSQDGDTVTLTALPA